MAPEQIHFDHISDKTDIYSLGICFYRLLTGKYPFNARKKEDVLNKHIEEPFPYLPQRYSYWDNLLQLMCHKSDMWRPNAIEVLKSIQNNKNRLAKARGVKVERREYKLNRAIFSLLSRKP